MSYAPMVIEVRENLLSTLNDLSSTILFAESEITKALKSIKSTLSNYSSLINSHEYGPAQTTKMILKVHQVIMEVSTEPFSLISNNCYESDTLYTLLETIEENPVQSSPLILRVELTENSSYSQDSILFINWKLLSLSVTARGSFNIFINAVFAKLLSSLKWNVKKIDEIDHLFEKANRICEESSMNLVDMKKYSSYLETFVYGNLTEIEESIQKLRANTWFSVINNYKESLKLIEKLLVGLLGHKDSKIRDLAIIHLNAFYDETDWQIISPLKPKVTTIGQEFCIREVVEVCDKDNLVLELHAPGFCRSSKNYVLSYHIPEVRTTKDRVFLKVDLGKFIRSGFYDWRFSQIKNGVLYPLMNNLPGSFNNTPIQGRFIVHPGEIRNLQIHEIFIDFQDAKFDEYSGRILQRGSFESVKNSLKSRYTSGINCLYLMGALERNTEMSSQNPDTSPLDSMCRPTACNLLGGVNEFKSMMIEAKEVGIKILIDCVVSISSTSLKSEQKNQQLFYRNHKNSIVLCNSSDGQGCNDEDSAMLNFRNSEVWQLLVDDILDFTDKFEIDGIHIDNACSWPQIMDLDSTEMYRKNPNGFPQYTTQEIFDGIIVKKNDCFSYWASDLREEYANPLFVKLCKELWRECPEFYIIADTWTESDLEDRVACIAKSGPVPKLYDLPMKLSSLFGKKLHKDGRFENVESKDVSIIRNWFVEIDKTMPAGVILVQSSTGHSLPYPALLYGPGACAAVDALFFLPFVPVTVIGEQSGHTSLSKLSSLFDFDDKNRQALLPSSIKTANLTELHSKSLVPKPEFSQVASTTSFSEISGIKGIETNLQQELGCNITKIELNYSHRRKIRAELDVLRYGDMIPLVFKHNHGWHKYVVAFARCLHSEISVILINFNEHPVIGYADLSAIKKYLTGEGTCVYALTYWFESNNEEYLFKEEILMDRHYSTISPYQSKIFSILPSKVTSERCLSDPLRRLKSAVEKNLPIDGNYLICILEIFLKSENFKPAVPEILNIIGLLQKEFLGKFSITSHALCSRFTRFDVFSLGKLFGVCDFLLESQDITSHPKKFAEDLAKTNCMGPITFICPEIGRFSTADGLGVMVDELSQGLAALGEEVWVISPYYDKNNKGESGYLANDKAGITWRANININFGGENYNIGLHQGWENGVNLIFLHNAILYPFVYADGKQEFVMRQLVGFGKSVLEALCWLRVIPSVMVTNDWFTGLVPAYAKNGAFGNTFEGTTFLHVVHNLDSGCEGRIFPTKAENFFLNIHQINMNWLVDPYWSVNIVNPSRCALMCSDQWATVSSSYRAELLASSPLKELLRNKHQPFAYPSGIPIKKKLQQLADKGTHLDAKLFLQKKYFNFENLDNKIPLLGFVGRITERAGVHLILEAAEQLIPKTSQKIQFLVGGQYVATEKYSVRCADKMKELRRRYPNNFFADPDNLFEDGLYVNLGSDFGLIPSKFEPGGIVQHEFFVAGTPVIAFKTGGLKDTVHDFNLENKIGSGFVFDAYFLDDFINTIYRALTSYAHKDDYQQLRENAFKATVDSDVVVKAWNKELYRLKGKIYNDFTVRTDTKNSLRGFNWSVNDFDDSLPENRNRNLPHIRKLSEFLLDQAANAKKVLEVSEQSKQQYLFTYKTGGIKLQSVLLTGSFDNWNIRHHLAFNHAEASWHITLLLPKGKFHYKFIINGNTWVHSFDHPTEQDQEGNVNNIVEIR